MDKSIVRGWENQIKGAIHRDGKTIYVRYTQNSVCPSCVIDPVSHEGRFNCSTCNGTGYYKVSTAVAVKAAVNTFIGSGSFVRYGNDKFSIVPIGSARITVWKEDVSKNPYSATAQTYFDSAVSVKIGTIYYAVKDIVYTGIADDTVCVVTLERKV
jgi:hypothetical protein